MKKLICAEGLLNDPLALSLLILGIIVVVVGVILYIAFVRKKLKNKLAESATRRKVKKESDDKAKSIVAGAFEEIPKPVEDEKPEAKKTKKQGEEEVASGRLYQNNRKD